ncbi:P-loop containing nucleoside triphosphate hydrolase protein [Thozetella sp. PMI_491]|nr:P-loop containing nucleoside triphosphate hydrolase protein [Thozetella sp. PMI_491]
MVETHSAGAGGDLSSLREKHEIGLVQGKGKGCIILLHGVPGVGKTSTAECVAAYTHRPLFPITCADIGYEPEKLEANLQKIFRLAHKWGCVLLIDEADVFLAERDRVDVKRNGLVSVFLRVLEYYSGILFLTTNRVGAFDDAFRSRIHLQLYYPRLDKEQSYKVWQTNIRRVLKQLNKYRARDDIPEIRLNKKKILRFAEANYEDLQWNGRQIQNAFQTAVALADFERHFVQIDRKPPLHY